MNNKLCYAHTGKSNTKADGHYYQTMKERKATLNEDWEMEAGFYGLVAMVIIAGVISSSQPGSH